MVFVFRGEFLKRSPKAKKRELTMMLRIRVPMVIV
jgi:hypothetical protein